MKKQKSKKKISLKLGDIISIKLDSEEYVFGQVIAKDKLGDVIEIYNYFSKSPLEYDIAIRSERLHYPNIIDSYSIFYIGEEGFDIVKNQNDDFRSPNDINELKYKMGSKELLQFYYLDGRTEKYNIENDNGCPWYSPQSDFDIKRLIEFWKNKNRN